MDNTTMALTATLAALKAQVDTMPAAMANTYDEPLDTIWMLLTAILVWFMSAGFCFLEMGSVRVKNSQNILVKNIIVPVVGFLCWYVTGYALAFGGTANPNKFIGGTYFVMYGFSDKPILFRHWFFQGTFCDTSASIVSGGIAERMTLIGYCVHTVFMTAFIYPVGVYWAWSGYGWLNFSEDGVSHKSTIGPRYQDWAGSGVIHLVGGVAALCGAIVVGPRKGRFDPDTDPNEFAPHSVPFTVLGTFILWFGWYGFNSGCTLEMHDPKTAFKAANAAVNTTLAPCAGGMVVFFIRRFLMSPFHFDVPAFCNGILVGLVAVTGPSGFVKHWESIIIGALAGVFYCLNCAILKRLKIDDPIDAVSVHMVGGLWGGIAIGFFGNSKEGLGGNGVFYGGNQLWVQVVACICFIVWSVVWSLLVFVPLRYFGLLRWGDVLQDLGADVVQHSPLKVYKSPVKAHLQEAHVHTSTAPSGSVG